MAWEQANLLKEQPRRVDCGQGQGVGGEGASSTRLTALPRFTFRNCPIQGQCAAWGNSQICPPGKLVQEGRRLSTPHHRQEQTLQEITHPGTLV